MSILAKKPLLRLNQLLLAMLPIALGVSMAFGQSAGADGAPRPITNESYKIGPGDVIDVVVTNNEKLSRSAVRVTNGGTIQLAMMDSDLPAACLTEREVADAIKEKYRKYLIDPFVNVSIREFNSNPVAVIGAVNSPGRFQLQRSIRLAELLTFVNGTAPNAGESAEIIRSGGRPFCEGSKLVPSDEAGDDVLAVNLRDAFRGGEQANPLILAGDIIRIAPADKPIELNAYIQGNVKASRAINLSEPITVTQAIAMAGGPAPGANLEKVKIRRHIPGSINRSEILANIKEINQRKRDDILLEPNDIVDVPGPSGVKKVLEGLLNSIAPTITHIPVAIIP